MALAVTNPLGNDVEVRVQLDFLDHGDHLKASAQRTEGIRPGTTTIMVPFSADLPHESHRFLWYRLRYHIVPINSQQSLGESSGVISVGTITPDFFHLKASSLNSTRPSQNFFVRVRAEHPLTAQPVKDVAIEARFEFDPDEGDPVKLKQSAASDASGYATFNFPLPKEIATTEGELIIKGSRGVLEQELSTEINIDHRSLGIVNTDKSLYQPGQTLHARVLVFDSARRALANKEVTIAIKDPEDEDAFRADVKTSRFGVASVDWVIPTNTRLGDYTVYSSVTESDSSDPFSAVQVKISRYDLPNFTVSAKSNRTYYTRGQNAEVEVRADYLFGQKVKRGAVRVVRETTRRWDYREQKWEIEEGEKYEGETDDEGCFLARIDLAEEHEKLVSEDYSRYTDLRFTAYFTDATTNRTEQRRFDLRLTKDPIHIYVVEFDDQSRTLALEFIVSASYADGSPAQCEVAIAATRNVGNAKSIIPLKTIATNRLGLAKVTGLAVSPDLLGPNNVLLNLSARDAAGNTGRHDEDIYFDRRPVLRLETNKNLYRIGEPISVEISSSQPSMSVVVQASRDGNVLRTEQTELIDGHASLLMPASQNFQNEITIVAYDMASSVNEYEMPFAQRTVLYPKNNSLRLEAILDHASYRPGDEARINFLSRLANGQQSETALGIVIFDKAVEERALTGNEYVTPFGFSDPYYALRGGFGFVAGITRKDLDRLDLTRPLAEGMDLVAELLLNNERYGPRPRVLGQKYEKGASHIFADLLNRQLKPIRDALDDDYDALGFIPTDEFAFKKAVDAAGSDFDDLRDPWETPYRLSFFYNGPSAITDVFSSGPDKHFGTPDDFVALRITRPYFRYIGETINRAVVGYNARTGSYIRNATQLEEELRRTGVDLDLLRDPWNQPYSVHFGALETRYVITIRSGGPDGKLEPQNDPDGFTVWTSSIDYSVGLKRQLERVVEKYAKNTNHIPENDTELDLALKQAGQDRTALVDPWGKPLYSSFSSGSFYGDRTVMFNQAVNGQPSVTKARTTPITQHYRWIHLRSAGPDGIVGTVDDFDVVRLFNLTEQKEANQQKTTKEVAFVAQGSTGAIKGTVTDPVGAVVPNATVTAKNILTHQESQAQTDDEGFYLVKNLSAGIYQLRVDAPGFKSTEISDIRVRSASVTEVNVAVDPGGVQETVSVTADSYSVVQNTSASVSKTRTAISSSARLQVATPRLRQYFPETLVWKPDIETDSRGRANLKFKLADNITTWKMSVIGSTEDGLLGILEQEFRAFQPFFVEHEPPRILTEGDEISLPVVVRNYLERPQPVRLSIKPESWFKLLGPTERNATIPAGEAKNEIFGFRAASSIKDGKQRITAIAAEESDAIEKPVTVHPDGQQVFVTAGTTVDQAATLDLHISENAIRNSAEAHIKIYPNLMGHVVESVEAILERPYGCGEQTISSTYPSLLLLKHFKKTGDDSPLRPRAERYLKSGYDRLLNYRDESGGYSYWGRGNADVALTAYALKFLVDTSEVMDVDQDDISSTRNWLVGKQRPDGSWPVLHYQTDKPDQRQSALLTAYVARTIAQTERGTRSGSTESKLDESLRKAFEYLSQSVQEFDEPYLLASFSLALLDSGQFKAAEILMNKLGTLAQRENEMTYWALETNTPFYGWGIAGRTETTALVIQALTRFAQHQSLTPPQQSAPHTHLESNVSPARQTNDQLVRSGLLFLLKQKDRYGVWYSTQTTINVLDALLLVLRGNSTKGQQAAESADILVNGQLAERVQMPRRNQLTGPITLELSRYLKPGPNTVTLRRSNALSSASIQLVGTYYVPWPTRGSDEVRTQHASPLRLVAKFDKTTARIGEEITCYVESERIGSRGYGMILAEIGLPPGADVERATLETAMKDSDWAFSQYDVLPDRVVAYLWPRAGGIKFSFKFRPRFGLKAKAAASSLYDYYNPEARVELAPELFTIK
ncbi:MAG TPA: MG2 domain-containing protein [Pyrinomonadaceae bacterium]